MKNRIGGNNIKVSVLDLIGLAELEDMQNSFAEVANVSLRTVDTNGKLLTKVSNAPSLCADVLQQKATQEVLCSKCLPSFLGGSGIVDEDFSFECLAGLKNYLVPLKVMLSDTQSIVVGYMVVGPVVFMKRRSKEEFEAVAKEVGVDPYQLWNLVLELRVFSYQGIRSLLAMIENLTSRILTLAYGKLAMQKKIFNVFSSKAQKQEGLLSSGIDEFLELFLDLLIDTTNGNKGSVMMLDKEKKALFIKASCGLSRDVVSGPALKLGDGIAGLAALTKKPFLINQGVTDEILADRLKKPEIFSSMIVPIKHNDDVYGVVNIASDNVSPVRFDESSLALVSKAAGLAGVALARFSN